MPPAIYTWRYCGGTAEYNGYSGPRWRSRYHDDDDDDDEYQASRCAGCAASASLKPRKDLRG
jgi:hypothetical protein